MPFQLSKDADGNDILVRENEVGTSIIYPKWYSRWNPQSNLPEKISYFARVNTGNDGWMNERGWDTFVCLYTEDSEYLDATQFNFRAMEQYKVRGNWIYPINKSDRRKRRKMEFDGAV